MEQTLTKLRASTAWVLERIILSPKDARKPNLYFFDKIELTMNVETLRERGLFRHCKFYKDKYYDYIVKKEFGTLEEWIADCGALTSNIMYGVNRFDGHTSYIELSVINALLTPDTDVSTDNMNSLKDFFLKLTLDGLGLPDVIVNTRDRGLQGYYSYMA